MPLTGVALDWAITFAASCGFLLFGYGKLCIHDNAVLG